MKKFFYSVPIDMKILMVIYMVTSVICQIYPHKMILVDLWMLYFVCFTGYYVANIKLSNRNERHCKYLLYWNIWGNKNNVFISMHKGKCVANEGDETPGKTEEEKLENELRNA